MRYFIAVLEPQPATSARDAAEVSDAALPVVVSRTIRFLDRVLSGFITALLWLDAALMTVAILSRTLLGTPITWVYELSLSVLVAIVFLGAVPAFQRDEHIGMNAIVQRWPSTLRPFVDAIALLLIAISSLVAVWQTIVLLENGVGIMPMSGLSKSILYIPVAIGLALIAGIALIRFNAKEFRSKATAALVVVAFAVGVWCIALQLPMLVQRAPMAISAIVFFACMAVGLPLAFDFGITTLVLILLRPGMALTTLPLQMVGGVNSFVLLALPFFVLTGALLTSGGIAASLLRFLSDITGKWRGGSAMAGVAGMYLFSGLSGAKIADVAAVAPVLAPSMREEGYPDAELVGILSASAAMGESVPPSLAILVLTAVTSVSTGTLFLAGLVPAGAVGLCILALIYFRSHTLGIERRTDVPKPREVAVHFLQALLPAGMPLLIFGGIIGGFATPIEASALAVGYGVLLTICIYRNPVKDVVAAAESASRLSAMLLFLLAMTTAFVWVITADGVAHQLQAAVTIFAGNKVAFMVATIALLILTGSIFEGLPAIVIFAPLLMPVAVSMDINTLQYSVVIVMAMGVGNFLPPFGIGYFATCALVGTKPERSVKNTLAYMAAALVGIVIVALVPTITTMIPHWAGLRGS